MGEVLAEPGDVPGLAALEQRRRDGALDGDRGAAERVPAFGLRLVTTGAGIGYAKSSALVFGLTPTGLVTATCTEPPACAGAVAISRVTPLLTDFVKLAVVPPKVTPVALLRPAPTMVTEAPAEPLTIDSWVTCGAGVIELSGPVMPVTVYAAVIACCTNAQDSLASPLLPQLVPHWLRMIRPSLSYPNAVIMCPPRLLPLSVL